MVVPRITMLFMGIVTVSVAETRTRLIDLILILCLVPIRLSPLRMGAGAVSRPAGLARISCSMRRCSRSRWSAGRCCRRADIPSPWSAAFICPRLNPALFVLMRRLYTLLALIRFLTILMLFGDGPFQPGPGTLAYSGAWCPGARWRQRCGVPPAKRLKTVVKWAWV